MAQEFFIPQLGQTVEQVTLVKWLVEDGAKVAQGQEICEVETDKAVFPVEANAKGYIHIGPFNEGDVLPVLTVVAIIGKETDSFVGTTEPEAGKQGDSAQRASTPELVSQTTPLPVSAPTYHPASPRARKLAAEKGVDIAEVTPTGYGGIRVAERDVVTYLASAPKSAEPPKAIDLTEANSLPRVTPVAQRMAADTGVDLRAVTGTGPGGKIIKDDITRAAVGQAVSLTSQAPSEIIERLPLKGVRAIIADRMAISVHTSARVTLLMEVDATELVAIRERLKAKVSEEWGFAPGYNDLLAKICAAALRKFPYMNARLAPDAIEILSHINIGLAVDTERGLLVPVVRDVDQKNLRQFGKEFRDLVDRARKSRSLPDDLSGGTFTITNLGMYEVDAFTPVINLPEAAILGVSRIAPKVVPLKSEGNEKLVATIRQMTTLSLVFDHRLVDGAPAAKFLQYIKQLIEEPYLLLTT